MALILVPKKYFIFISHLSTIIIQIKTFLNKLYIVFFFLNPITSSFLTSDNFKRTNVQLALTLMTCPPKILKLWSNHKTFLDPWWHLLSESFGTFKVIVWYPALLPSVFKDLRWWTFTCSSSFAQQNSCLLYKHPCVCGSWPPAKQTLGHSAIPRWPGIMLNSSGCQDFTS